MARSINDFTHENLPKVQANGITASYNLTDLTWAGTGAYIGPLSAITGNTAPSTPPDEMDVVNNLVAQWTKLLSFSGSGVKTQVAFGTGLALNITQTGSSPQRMITTRHSTSRLRPNGTENSQLRV